MAETFLPRALKLIPKSDNETPQARSQKSPDVATSRPQAVWDLSTQDKTFWATLAGADRRLTELRRAIDEAAAEVVRRETSAEGQAGAKANLGESRCKAASRMISDALKTEKP